MLHKQQSHKYTLQLRFFLRAFSVLVGDDIIAALFIRYVFFFGVASENTTFFLLMKVIFDLIDIIEQFFFLFTHLI